MREKLRYKNITVSGFPCAGSTTLSQGLYKKLKPLGWQYFNAGQFFRDYCKKHNLPLEEAGLRSEQLTKKIDCGMREKLEKREKNLLEGWLSGFMARGIPGVLKILLVCDDALRIDRLVNRDNLTVAQAKKLIKKREEENLKKWSKVYKTTDFWDPKHYDLVINTYSNSKEETLALVLQALGFNNGSRQR